jgi:hypothetical protein
MIRISNILAIKDNNNSDNNNNDRDNNDNDNGNDL